MNKWFVANDNGDVIGHDMPETAAKLLASEMKTKPEFFYICYYGTSGDGYVGYDNNPTNTLDNVMKFDSEEEAEKAIPELKKEWDSELIVEAVFDDTWEALNGADE